MFSGQEWGNGKQRLWQKLEESPEFFGKCFNCDKPGNEKENCLGDQGSLYQFKHPLENNDIGDLFLWTVGEAICASLKEKKKWVLQAMLMCMSWRYCPWCTSTV